MKKYFAALVLLMAALMLCACGETKANPTEAPAAQAPAAAEKTENASPTMPTVADKTGEVEVEINVETPTAPTVADRKDGEFDFDFGVETPTMPTVAEIEGMDTPAVTVPEAEEISYEMAEALDGAKTIAYGQEQTAKDLIRFTLEDAYLAEEILPSQPGLSYSYMEKMDGYKYLVISGTLTNISNKEIRLYTTYSGGMDTICTWFRINDQLYLGKWVSEEPDGSSITGRIQPGETGKLYIFAGIAEEDCKDLKNITLVTGFKDFETTVVNGMGGYQFKWDECAYKYTMEIDDIQ